jgi:hypothetical protein
MTNDRKIKSLLMLAASWLAATPAHAQPDVLFIPASRGELYAADTYRTIWEDYGERIVAALESRTCMPFAEPVVWARVAEAVSNSGGPDHPMRLRASYDRDAKASTLVHELGHRHLWQLSKRLSGINSHMTLYLILDRVWADVWGDAFAARRIDGESVWDDEYENAWAWAQSLGVDRRTALWNRLLRINGFDGYCYGPLDERARAHRTTIEPELRLSDARSALGRAITAQ